MKVIFLTDVKGQGKKDELKEVSDGYARNYLIPRKLVMEATNDTINAIKIKEKAKLAHAAKEKALAEENAKKLESLIVKVPAKAGAGGKLFGSVTSKEISEELQKQYGIAVDKKDIVQSDPIKNYGTYSVKCRLGHEVSGTINLIVTEEK
ncbi:MAG: 50S ribosomal protein L9 [Oscillospiraceae bacterium]|nr:50S ribosomal protein L9 [Oscillospiraceae bacterium]